ncbi:MAG TPA: hypothetical protein VIC06_15160 [Solirubrobacteraceae bacterium]
MATKKLGATAFLAPLGRFRGCWGFPGESVKVCNYWLRLVLDVVGGHDQALEDRLVEQPPMLWWAAHVGGVAVRPDQQQRLIEGLEDVLGFVRGRLD